MIGYVRQMTVGFLMIGLVGFTGLSVGPAAAQTVEGGPVALLGIDTEDGGPGGHGPASVYVDVVESLLTDTTNNGQDILVIGDDGSATNHVTQFWNEIGTQVAGHSVEFVGGPTGIENQDFTGYALIAVTTSTFETSGSHGLTNDENDALIARSADVAAFVNNGGGLFASSQTGLNSPWGYIGEIGGFVTNTGLSYTTIEPTPEGEEVGITTALNLCCWHDTFTQWPGFLNVLAWRSGLSGEEAAVLGGATVRLVPPGPQNLTAEAGPGDGEISLAWDPPEDNGTSNITHYNIYSGSSISNLSLLDNVSVPVTVYTHTGLQDGETRFYQVRAVNGTGESDPSNTGSATTFDVPEAPRDLTVSALSDTVVKIEWNAPAWDGGKPISEYRLYRAKAQGSMQFLTTLPSGDRSHNDTGLEQDVLYHYNLSAVNSQGEGDAVGPVNATTFSPPGPPQGFVVTSGPGEGEISLDWEPPLDDGGVTVSGYHIYRGDTADSLVFLDNVSASQTNYTDNGLGEGNLRFYQVAATNAIGEGEPTDPVGSTSPPGGEPDPLPAGRSATSAVFQGHYGYVFGGRDENGDATESIVRFDPDDGSTLTLGFSLPDARLGTSAIWSQGHSHEQGGGDPGNEGCHPNCGSDFGFIFGGSQESRVSGGQPGTGSVGTQVLEFDPEQETVTVRDANFTEPRFGTSAVWDTTSNVAYVIGGFPDETAGGPVGHQIMVFDPEEDTLVLHEASLPEALGGTSAVWDPVDQVAYIFGGLHRDDGDNPSATGCHPNCGRNIFVFDPYAPDHVGPAGVDPLPVDLPGERWNTSAVFDGRYAYIIGGENETGTIDEILRFDPVEQTVQVVGSLPTSRAQTSAVYDGADVYIFGGLQQGNESTNEIVRFTPTAPQQADARAGPGVGETTVSWSEPADDGGADVQSYRVYRRVNGLLQLVGEVQEATSEFVDADLDHGTTYHYRVSAVNEIGESPMSPLASATTFDRPQPPEQLNFLPGPDFGELTLQWEPPEDDGGTPVTGYNVYRSEQSNGTFVLQDSVPGGDTSFTDSGLGELDTRYYRVGAVNLVGEGSASDELEAKTYDPMNIFVREGGLTIQRAVDALAEGGTVHVAPGTYAEEIRVDKAGTIRAGTAEGPTGSGQARPVVVGGFLVEDVSNFTLVDLEVQATPTGDLPGVGLRTLGVGVLYVEHVRVRSNGDPQGTGIYPGVVDVDGVREVTFVDNRLDGDPTMTGGSSGVRIRYGNDPHTRLSLENNTVLDVNGAGLVLQGSGPDAVINLTENRFTGNGDGLVVFQGSFAGLTSVDNVFSENGDKGVQYVGAVQGESRFRFNRFTGNGVGFAVNDAADPVDARHNWWGNPGGPPLGDQSNMLAVDYTPWCLDEECGVDETLDPVLPET